MTKEHIEQPELLPCPFCGGDVGLEQAINSPGPRKWWGVVCRNTANLGGTCSIQQMPSASPDAAAKRWNRRTQSASQARVPLPLYEILHFAGEQGFVSVQGNRAFHAFIDGTDIAGGLEAMARDIERAHGITQEQG